MACYLYIIYLTDMPKISITNSWKCGKYLTTNCNYCAFNNFNQWLFGTIPFPPYNSLSETARFVSLKQIQKIQKQKLTGCEKSYIEIHYVKPQIRPQRNRGRRRNVVINKFKPTLWIM